jgi:hypothetical protein
MSHNVLITRRGVGSDELRPPRGSAFKINMIFIDASIDNVGNCILTCSFVVVNITVRLVWLDLSRLRNALQSPRAGTLYYPLAMFEETDRLNRQNLQSAVSANNV